MSVKNLPQMYYNNHHLLAESWLEGKNNAAAHQTVSVIISKCLVRAPSTEADKTYFSQPSITQHSFFHGIHPGHGDDHS